MLRLWTSQLQSITYHFVALCNTHRTVLKGAPRRVREIPDQSDLIYLSTFQNDSVQFQCRDKIDRVIARRSIPRGFRSKLLLEQDQRPLGEVDSLQES